MPAWKARPRFTKAAATRCAKACSESVGRHAAEGQHVLLGADSRAVAQSRMSTMDFGMMLLEKGNVAVSPGSGFGPAGEGFLRMSLVENEARLRQAVRQIQRCLREAEAQFSGAGDDVSPRRFGVSEQVDRFECFRSCPKKTC